MNPNDSGTANTGNGHLNVPGDEVPPPPYSETDVYSTSGSSRSHTASAPSVAAPATAAAATPSHSFVDDAASSTADEVIYTPPLTPRTSPGSGQPAATLYFDLRPAPQQDSSSDIIRMTLVHTIEVTDISQPDDFPYESDWAARDVTALDWSTFINFLIPDHTTRQNEVVIHRKLLDEMQRSEAGSTNNSTAQVEAQLNQIADARNPTSPDSQRRRRDVEATVQQWNDGFFGPRGIQVRLEPPRTPSAQMPGAWEANFDQVSEAGRSTQSSQTAGRSAPAGGGSWGGFQIDDNGVRYGNSFVADQNGLRIGNLIMDQRGIRFQNGAEQGQQPAADAARDIRGRTAYQHGGDEEAHKRSASASSTSSSSSSSSESSIGSLPSYDDIPVNSVQLYIARLQDWTKNPDQLRTKGDVKQLKAELKSVPKSKDVITDVDKKALKAQIKTLTTVWRQVKKNQRREHRAQRKERRGKRRAERKEKRQHRKEMRKARKEARKGQSTPVPPPPPPPGIPPLPPHVPGATVPPVPPVPPVNTAPWTGSFPWGRPQHGRGGRGGRHHPHPHPHPHSHPHPHQPHYGLPRGGGWGAWNNPQASGENGMFGSRGPFGPEGPFGPGGPFGEKGIFGGDGLFGPKGFFGPGQDEKQQQQQREQQQQQAEQQRQQQQQHAEQQRQQQQQHAEQQRQHYQQQAEQQRQHAEQQRQHYQQQAEQQRQHYNQQAEQQRQYLQQHQDQQWQQYHQQRQGSASSNHSLPGSWPDEKKQQQPTSASQDDEQIPPPGPRASAKYNTIGALERTIQAQTAAAEKAEGVQKEQVEKAIATMRKQLEALRVQADEEYAKELSGN